MNMIPYLYVPIPKYFHEEGLFDPHKNKYYVSTIIFVNWAFNRCRPYTRKIFHDASEIKLEPFEFIFGRLICMNETGLLEKTIRGQLNCMLNCKILEKRASSRASRFTVYRWVTEHFSKTEGQLKGQQWASCGPAEGPQIRILESKKEKRARERDLPVGEKEEKLNGRCFGDHPDDAETKKEMEKYFAK